MFSSRLLRTRLRNVGFRSSSQQCGPNDKVSPTVRNRNPMNLEKMRIAYKPKGFELDKGNRSYWNALELSLSKNPAHATATVKHWTGRTICKASTREWAIEKFLYNNTDLAAVKIVGKVLGQRCLETGITEVTPLIDKEALEKDKIKAFVNAISETGLILAEPDRFQPNDRFRLKDLKMGEYKTKVKPWEISDE